MQTTLFTLKALLVAVVLTLVGMGLPTAHGVGSGPPIFDPYYIAVETTGTLVVVDRDVGAVIRVDPATGDRTVVSDATTGSGPPFTRPQGIAVEADGRLVVTDCSLGAVIRVDPATGDRTVVSDATTGSGPPFGYPYWGRGGVAGIAVEADGQIVVVDRSLGAVIRVDPTTGNRTVVSGTTPHGIAIEADDQIVVTDNKAVIRVDPVTGNRTVVSH